MMYEVEDYYIKFSLSQLEFDILLHGIDMSTCTDSEFICIRNMLCDIYDRMKG
mgnify:CR=1 FL=1